MGGTEQEAAFGGANKNMEFWKNGQFVPKRI